MPYFDLSSKEFCIRFLYSLIPFNSGFHPLYHAKPDLYGPFWILTSLIAALFISGNISRYVRLGKADFKYNFTVIPVAASIIYGVGIGLPLLLHYAIKYFGRNV